MFKRFRDRRTDHNTRLKYQETFLKPADFIWPVFLLSGSNKKMEIPSMPGVYQYSTDFLLTELDKLSTSNLSAVLLFGVPENKGLKQAYSAKGIIQTAIPQIKKAFPQLEIITDVCLCSYSEDGQCHIGDNDNTIELLAQIALSHAAAGADTVAPSDMMDGRVYAIRKMLTANHLTKTKIMSYAAKYASNYYGPFRDAASSAPKKGDRKSYQMNPANTNEAMEEIEADIKEGADSIIIKPALAYLDIIYRARQAFKVPLAAYNVSGEYAMLQYLIQNKLAKEDIIYETLLGIKRAGANRIISYFTPTILEKLNDTQ